MRALLRILAPLLGLALAGVGVLLVIEVVAAWARPGTTAGLVVPWQDWRTTLADVHWQNDPVPEIAIGVAVVGLLLVLVALSARRTALTLEPPAPEMTVTTSARVLARLVGTRVRAADDVAAASVTASGRRIAVSAEAWNDADPQLQQTITTRVDELLTELPLRRSPRVRVAVTDRKGPR